MSTEKDQAIIEESNEQREEAKNRYKYDELIIDAIVKLIEKGPTTVRNICKAVGISEASFYLWRKEIADFREKLLNAKKKQIENRLDMAEVSLASLMDGGEYTETTKEVVDGVLTVTKEVTKVREPSLAAIKHYQTNKAPLDWKERQTIENQHSGDIKASFTVNVIDSGIPLAESEEEIELPNHMKD